VVARSPGQTLANTWIEFGNRLLTFAVMAVAVAVCAAAWHFRPVGRDGLARRRAGLVWLAIAQPAGVVLQAVLGGITVLTKLNPAMVAVHFLVSMAIVAVTVVFYVRCAEDDVPAAALVRADLRLLTGAVLAAAGLMFAAGTVVTGAGPLAGNANAHRFQLPLGAVTQVHADIGWLLGGLAITLAAGLALSDAPPRAVRLGWLLLGMLAVQGAVGYTQYFTGLPPILVGLHVLGSVLVWIIAVRLLLALRDRGSVTTTPAAAGGPHT
jgi:cytochrome c oxidase assembly protein subunit 15